ncbi:MAG: DNA-directed RNA polymerase subunit omega [Thermoanaerobaculia bacterium]|nr:DNA-directed RNA polymerase subunit omega [Thermoanaerobaculia bacterium]
MTEIPEKIDSKYRYVLLAAARAEQMIQGASPKNDALTGKPTRVAMQEISRDEVEWDYGPAEEPEVEGGDESEVEAAAEGEESAES